MSYESLVLESVCRARGVAPPSGDPAQVLKDWFQAGKLTTAEALRCVALEYAYETVAPEELVSSPAAVAALAPAGKIAFDMLPLTLQGRVLTVAISNPLDQEKLDYLGRELGLTIDARLAWPSDLVQARGRAIGSPTPVREPGSSVGYSPAADGQTGQQEESDAPIVRYVQHLFDLAVRLQASDIHVEPMEQNLRVRFRIDGILREIERPPKRLQPAIVARLKVLSGMSLAEKRLPQDGRIRTNYEGRPIDWRASAIPTTLGESLVLRLLDPETLRPGLAELGFWPDDLENFHRLLTAADGMLLVTGPTGSGKSTTLYAVLQQLNQPDRKIITVEEPVEYQIPGINQVAVRKETGMTFLSALRAILRQAPNIIMIGEIRDGETAETAIQAALTGHSIYSTLHTNDAPGAVTRLCDLGLPSYLIAAALRGVLAQRLVRRICPACAGEHHSAGTSRRIPCQLCRGSGWKGRVGLFELLRIDAEMAKAVQERASLLDMRNLARQRGMKTLREDGLRKVEAGWTRLSEVLAHTMEV